MENTVEDAHELTWFCTDLTDLRADARQEGWSAELERILAELRDGTRPAAAVLEAVRVRLGMPARPRAYTPFPGQEAAPPPAGSYTCPGGRCSRVEDRRPGAPLPECAVYDEPFTFG
ncbi:hypothetical protein [Streptomyces vietnamensis]|uniref:Uncharacterized protein n=1 Tax=Streptomyces vietnamensis TaxID=362257 RepID=A0A0B5I4E0_9ACTN|nr:hypothetical protein [Streptomyces vietnamensis]AJF67431.1 hypothetical protein SVTN_26695 [Streptomyces vietnamensis]